MMVVSYKNTARERGPDACECVADACERGQLVSQVSDSCLHIERGACAKPALLSHLVPQRADPHPCSVLSTLGLESAPCVSEGKPVVLLAGESYCQINVILNYAWHFQREEYHWHLQSVPGSPFQNGTYNTPQIRLATHARGVCSVPAADMCAFVCAPVCVVRVGGVPALAHAS